MRDKTWTKLDKFAVFLPVRACLEAQSISAKPISDRDCFGAARLAMTAIYRLPGLRGMHPIPPPPELFRKSSALCRAFFLLVPGLDERRAITLQSKVRVEGPSESEISLSPVEWIFLEDAHIIRKCCLCRIIPDIMNIFQRDNGNVFL